MASYVVMEPPGRAGAERAVLVRDGFHVLAFVLPVVWLLFHRLWLEALAVLAIGMAIGGLGSWLGFNSVAGFGSLMLGVLVGLEGAALKVAALRRRGWREWGVVEADDADDAETRYLAEAVSEDDGEPPAGIVAPARPPHRAAASHSGPALGMLFYPGRG